MPDGKITFSTDLDNKQLEKKLTDLNQKIESSEKKLFDKREQQSAIRAELQSAKEEAQKTESGTQFSVNATLLTLEISQFRK